jgi:putative SOS response-associated peptidase YedK
MCGRYYSLFDKQQVAEHFHVLRTADNVGIIAPNYNVAPGDPQPVIRRRRETGERAGDDALGHCALVRQERTRIQEALDYQCQI